MKEFCSDNFVLLVFNGSKVEDVALFHNESKRIQSLAILNSNKIAVDKLPLIHVANDFAEG